MESKLEVNQGDIFWSITRDENGKTREIIHPQVIIQDDLINKSRVKTVVACEISTNIKKVSEPGNILLELGEGNLKKQSIIITSHISSIRKSDLGDFIGRIGKNRIEQIYDKLRLLNRLQE